MATSHQIWERAKKNCLGYKKQFQERTPDVRVYAKVGLDDLFYLLDNVAHSARGQSILLRDMMCSRPWELVATVHRGGRGDSDRPPDQELHFNMLFPGSLGIQGRHFHIRCKARPDESVHVFDIKE